jgi:hypothetical protein
MSFNAIIEICLPIDNQNLFDDIWVTLESEGCCYTNIIEKTESHDLIFFSMMAYKMGELWLAQIIRKKMWNSISVILQLADFFLPGGRISANPFFT